MTSQRLTMLRLHSIGELGVRARPQRTYADRGAARCAGM